MEVIALIGVLPGIIIGIVVFCCCCAFVCKIATHFILPPQPFITKAQERRERKERKNLLQGDEMKNTIDEVQNQHDQTPVDETKPEQPVQIVIMMQPIVQPGDLTTQPGDIKDYANVLNSIPNLIVSV